MENTLFSRGSLVEVCSDDEGFKDAWYVATVLGSPTGSTPENKNYMLSIEYHTLVADENGSEPLRELADLSHVRPAPPVAAGDLSFELDDVVDAFYRDGWWRGVVTGVHGNSKYSVFFRNPPEEMEFKSWELRYHHEWVDGKWLRAQKQHADTPNQPKNEIKRGRPPKSNAKRPRSEISGRKGRSPKSQAKTPQISGTNKEHIRGLDDVKEVVHEVSLMGEVEMPVNIESEYQLNSYQNKREGQLNVKYKKRARRPEFLTKRRKVSAAGNKDNEVEGAQSEMFGKDGSTRGANLKSKPVVPSQEMEYKQAKSVAGKNLTFLVCSNLLIGDSTHGNRNEDTENFPNEDLVKSLETRAVDRGETQNVITSNKISGQDAQAASMEAEMVISNKRDPISEVKNSNEICSVTQEKVPQVKEFDEENLKIITDQRKILVIDSVNCNTMSSSVARNPTADTEKVPDKDRFNKTIETQTQRGEEHQSVTRTTTLLTQADVLSKSVSNQFMETTEMKDENQKLPFVKNSPIWKAVESMEIFRKFPQNPHFLPLEKCKEECREGLAIGYMIAFSGIAEKTIKLQIDDPKSKFKSSLEALLELEKHGFDVKAVQARLNEVLMIKEKEEQIQEKLREMVSQLDLLVYEKKKKDEEIHEIDEKLKELEEKRISAKSMNGVIDCEMVLLRSTVDRINEEIKKARFDFERLTAVSWS